MEVRVLGPLEVVGEQGRALAVGGPRVRALLTRLALQPGASVPADALVDGLWGDAGDALPSDQANALQSLVSRLRRALPDPALVVSGPGGYRLAVDAEDVDAVRFERLAQRGRRALAEERDPDAAARLLREALTLWRGPALADATAAGVPYAAAPAARLEGLRLAAREDLCEAELSAGRAQAALPDIEALAAEEPLRERPLALLMRARYAAGRQAEALAAYEAFRARLADELGVDPSPGLRELHLAVLRADPALAVSAHARTRTGNLRAALTSFVGRDEELRLIAKRLSEGRLVTLTGPGGAGKTRLATTAAAGVADDYPGGVWLVELASVGDPDDVPQAVLGTVCPGVGGVGGVGSGRPLDRGRPSATPRDAMGLLAEEFPDAPTLLVLDNCEHLIGAAARLAERLLGVRPRLRVLATSREPLAILGEALCPVPPLAVPGPGEPVASAAAVRLFTDRAAAVRPGFAVGEENAEAVVEICRRLDGLPLAIELAAARLRALTPAQLAARLHDRFRLLTGGSRTAMPRHQTLRAVVAWSWELLTDAERDLAERLAVFAGGAGGATPASVAGVTGVSEDEALELLASLADKSLLHAVDDGGGGGAAEEPRFRMLETLREYGLERLAERGRVKEARDAHAAYFVRLAEAAEPELRGPGQLVWVDRLIAEHDNLLAALHHAAGGGDAVVAIRLAAGLGMFWTMRGNHAEAANWLEMALAAPGAERAPRLARVLATVHFVMNRLVSGAVEQERIRPMIEAVGAETERLAEDDPGVGHAVVALIRPALALFDDRHDRGMEEAARALSEPGLDPWARAMLRLMRAAILENEGDPVGELTELEAAVAAFREVGDRWGLAMTLTQLGELHTRRGEAGPALATLGEARHLMQELRAEPDRDSLRIRLAVIRAGQGDPRGRAELLEVADLADRKGLTFLRVSTRLALGDLERRRGDAAEAARHYAVALSSVDGHTWAQPQLNALVRASSSMVEPETGRAAALLREALNAAVDVTDMPVTAAVGVAIAAFRAERGAPADPLGDAVAAGALGAAAALRGMAGAGPDIERLTGLLRRRLGEAAYAAAYGRGLALSREAAIEALRAAIGPG
ncbi:BTAD domain-containing putative transcriptional regulator [Streptomyces sp. 6N223]|uniref:BTAD domain-containing putative transcriptional regulator n=1 Tax=Streptomyces sp. 6N223 TaxID=3457412 RepID=UPI003FD2CDD6